MPEWDTISAECDRFEDVEARYRRAQCRLQAAPAGDAETAGAELLAARADLGRLMELLWPPREEPA